MGFKSGDFPEAEQYSKEAISIPIFHGLKKDQQDVVIQAITEVLAWTSVLFLLEEAAKEYLVKI